MIIKTQYSANFSTKSRKIGDIKIIVIHYTGMQSKIASIQRLLSLRHKVSCHYLIDRKGKILRMVEDNKVAWHAGKSKWKNFNNLNKNSIGIELVNKGHEFGYEKFTNIQISKLILLCLKIKKKYKINSSNIVGHSDIAPLRKQDPGEKFPWNKMENQNLGICYKKRKLSNQNLKYQNLNEKKIRKFFFKNLFKIGYRYINLSSKTKRDIPIIKAFQRRFLRNNISGKIDQKTLIISDYLANKNKK